MKKEPTLKIVVDIEKMYKTKLYVRQWWGWKLVGKSFAYDDGRTVLRRYLNRISFYNSDGTKHEQL